MLNKRALKDTALSAMRLSGAFHLRARTSWRRQRVLILCYHAFTLTDEDVWNPDLYFTRQAFVQRMETLKRGGYNVLPLGEAFDRLGKNSLPERSVVITVDDGTYDFYREGYPVLQQYGYPATVYLTTFLCVHRDPVFPPALLYMLWKAGLETADLSWWTGDAAPTPLSTREQQLVAGRAIIAYTEHQKMSYTAKTDLLAEIAAHLGVDFARLRSERMFEVMNPEEVRAVHRNGIDIQLHTHRHRTPLDRDLFLREIRENRNVIRELTGTDPVHFCYPLGRYNPVFLPWLRDERVQTATTCKIDLAHRSHEPLLLPRFVDTLGQTQTRFESWCSGAATWLPRDSSYKYEDAPE